MRPSMKDRVACRLRNCILIHAILEIQDKSEMSMLYMYCSPTLNRQFYTGPGSLWSQVHATCSTCETVPNCRLQVRDDRTCMPRGREDALALFLTAPVIHCLPLTRIGCGVEEWTVVWRCCERPRQPTTAKSAPKRGNFMHKRESPSVRSCTECGPCSILLLSFSLWLFVILVTRGDLVSVSHPLAVPLARPGGVAQVEGPLFQTLGDVGRRRRWRRRRRSHDLSCRF